MTAAGRARVLLVDDNRSVLECASTLLSQECLVVGTLMDGRAALDAVRTLRPDVVVLDISMPGINGFEVAGRLRAAGSTVAIVFLTIHDGPEFVTAARASGGIGYVTKTRLATDLLLAVTEAQAGRPFISGS